MGHGPNLIPDETLLIQVGIFFACYFVLKILVFKPYLELIRIRREKTVGLELAAEEAQKSAKARREKYEAFMVGERKKTIAWADDERRSIGEEENKIIQAGRDSAGKELDVLRSNSQAEIEKARKELAPLVSEYASAIASKLLGRKVQISAGSRGKGPEHSEQVARN